MSSATVSYVSSNRRVWDFLFPSTETREQVFETPAACASVTHSGGFSPEGTQEPQGARLPRSPRAGITGMSGEMGARAQRCALSHGAVLRTTASQMTRRHVTRCRSRAPSPDRCAGDPSSTSTTHTLDLLRGQGLCRMGRVHASPRLSPAPRKTPKCPP